MSEPTNTPEEAHRRFAEWLERDRGPVQRPRLVEHLLRTGSSSSEPEGQSVATGLMAILRRQSAKLAEAERELAEQAAKLETVEAELRLATEHARTAREIEVRTDETTQSSHLLFVPDPAGYALLEAPGQPPRLGSEVQLGDEESRFVVSRVSRSPYPGDVRRCAYLLRLS